MKYSLINKSEFITLLSTLAGEFTLIGPRIRDSVITFDRITHDDFPVGFEDIQRPGYYRLRKKSDAFFAFHPGPDSLKKFLHPSFSIQHSFQRSKKTRLIDEEYDLGKTYAFIGVRACDIKALDIMNRVFEGVDEGECGYFGHRRNFIVAVACARPSDNCFCSSMNTGPEIKIGFDILLTELENGFILETGSEKGKRVSTNLIARTASEKEIGDKSRLNDESSSFMKKKIDIDDLPRFLYRHFESSVWKDIVERCLACGNCTQVCPTCFCNTSFDLVTLSGMKKKNEFSGRKLKKWDSCFSRNFARVHGANFRLSRSSRYRHWFNHKFGYWLDQFGVSGCVGCGRCITWCPVGIDVTEEMKRLRG